MGKLEAWTIRLADLYLDGLKKIKEQLVTDEPGSINSDPQVLRSRMSKCLQDIEVVASHTSTFTFLGVDKICNPQSRHVVCDKLISTKSCKTSG